MSRLIDRFESFTRDQIISLSPGAYGDYELLDVAEFFEEVDGDDHRAAGVYELILRSPEVSEMVAYSALYEDLANYYLRQEDYSQALAWNYAYIAYAHGHQSDVPLITHQIVLAAVYLKSGELDLALAIYNQMLQLDSANILIYNAMGIMLPMAGLFELAEQALKKGLELSGEADPEELREQLVDLLNENEELKSQTDQDPPELDPQVIAELRATLARPVSKLHDLEISLPYPSPVEELIQTCRSPGEELLTKNAGKIGGYNTQALMAIAADMTLDLFVRVSMLEALSERFQKVPGLSEEIIAFLERMLTRPEAHRASEEEFSTWVVDTAFKINARQLYPLIRQAFDEDRLDKKVIDLAVIHEEWGLEPLLEPERRTDGMYLPLSCKRCGRTREHFTQYVLMEGDFLFESLQARESGYKRPTPGANPRVLYMRSSALGRDMHPLEALENYFNLIAANPNDPALYLRPGNLLRVLMRYDKSRNALERAFELAPENPDVVVALAVNEHDFGDPNKARDLYQKTLELKPQQGQSLQSIGTHASVTAVLGLRALERERSSPWKYLPNSQMASECLTPR